MSKGEDFVYNEETIVSFSTENASNINLSEIWNKSGIWITYGKTEENADYTCLEVGQTTNIKNELESDFKLIISDCCENGIKVRCFRREWSKPFLKRKGETRQSAKWRDIANSYNHICIKYVRNSEEWNLQKRIEEEINIAINLHAIYFYPDNTKRQCSFIRQCD